MKKNLAILALAVLVSSCSSPQRALQSAEESLGTDGSTPILFHSTLYYPKQISLNFPGFIIGVEKSKPDFITKDAKSEIVVSSLKSLGIKDGYDFVVDSKTLYVSHVLENKGLPYGEGNCFIYNAYNQSNDAQKQTLAPCHPETNKANKPTEAYKNSWQALDLLKAEMKQKIQTENYTHIIVMTMGWNTAQEEAMRNFNSIMGNINTAAKNEVPKTLFKPLFIGVTWPSQWQGEWLDPIFKGLSFPTKQKDADELGVTWLGVLLHQTIPDVNVNNLPVTVVGHSFGARASATAACMGPVIKRMTDASPIQRATIDKLVAWQGAFSINRLLKETGDGAGIIYPNHCDSVRKIFLTASINDKAVTSAIWGSYAGANEKFLLWRKGFKQYCDTNTSTSNLFCTSVELSGELKPKPSNDAHIVYINADKLIYKNAYLSGGGAHSDIYREEHGVLNWSIIK